MCGIAGILYLHDRTDSTVGSDLMTMSRCLQHRGADSAGIAVFGAPSTKIGIQIAMPLGAELPEPQYIDKLSQGCLTGLRPEPNGFAAYVTSMAADTASRAALVKRLEEGIPGSVVISLGASMTVHKTVGEVGRLADQVAPLRGTHGIAHLRLATESKIDPAHAQPFWGRPFSDIAVTHNGHITNYYKQRQKLEARGYSFASKNDSEIIGILIGEQISKGFTLNDALPAAVAELDGSFSFIVATATGLGVARDPFATKPLLYTERENIVAIASEQQALHRLFGETLTIREIEPREYRTWEKA